jgi:hypothetical protein
MSISICWRPVAESKGTIEVGATSTFSAAIQAEFGPFPVKLGRENCERLSGMAALFPFAMIGPVYGAANPYRKLVDLIDQFGTIEVWGEF